MYAWKLGAGSAAGALLASLLAAPGFAADVTQQRLENADADPANWITTFQNYSSHRYSRLDEIDRSNVSNLKMAFTLPITTALIGGTSFNNPQIESPTLVEDGMMYFTDGWGTVYKVDVRDGVQAKVLWRADPAVDKEAESPRTRGPALWGDKVYTNLVDGRVIAVDTNTGEIVWDQQVARTEEDWEFDAGEKFTAAPLAVEGKILVSQSAGDWGTRGFLAALDAETGEEQWRTYVVPGPGEPGHETWGDDHNAWRTGGGGMWTTGAYDPDQQVAIWGTGNPVPMFDPEFRPGDNLYTDSVLAFDINDGAIKWYFQYVPNESWDYDEQGAHLLYDAEINGEMRKVVSHFARNGHFYQVDRTNGTFINAAVYVKEVNWTAGLDPKTGMPLEYDPAKAVQTYIPATRNSRANPEVQSCPTPAGGIRWQPVAFNPDKFLAYGAGGDGCAGIKVEPQEPVGAQGGNPMGVNKTFLGGTGDFNPKFGSINAIDVRTGTRAARTELTYQNKSGVLATSGGLIFTGELDGTVTAYNDETLEKLWGFNTGIVFKSPPVSYSVNGKQYVSIIGGGENAPDQQPDLAIMQAGAMLFVFSL